MKNNSNQCLGCGVIKHTNSENQLGYVLSLEHEYCLDCFKLKNYGINYEHNHPTKYLDIKDNSLILILQSVMQLDLLFSLPIYRIQPNAKYVYVINQLDLLPKDTNLDHLYNSIHKKAFKANIKYEDIIFMSALNSEDTFNLKDYLVNQPIKDIYLFGFQNSGKTTIMKALTNNSTALNINKAGLTQDIIIEQLEDKILYDMPGTYVKGYISDYLKYEDYSKILPKKLINPKIYQLKSTQKLVVNDLIEISFTGLDTTTLVLYLNSNNKITKYNKKNENNYLNEELEYSNKTFKTLKVKSHITIADILFLHVNEECIINIKAPKEMHLTMMEALFK